MVIIVLLEKEGVRNHSDSHTRVYDTSCALIPPTKIDDIRCLELLRHVLPVCAVSVISDSLVRSLAE